MKRKMNWIRIICLILTLVWMGVIFAFSAQSGEESSQTSAKVVDAVAPVIIPHYNRLSSVQQMEKRESLSYLIRKGAHFTEYALLGLFVSFTLPWGRMKRVYTALIAFGICALYAVSDEFHQNFSAGRSPALFDVLIDSSGALTGILCACLILWIALRWKTRKKKDRKKKNRTPA